MGGSAPLPTPSLQDLARSFLSFSGLFAQRDVVGASLFSAAGITSAGALPGPAVLVTSSAPLACASASVPASGMVSSAGAASVTGSSGRLDRTWESPRPERCSCRSSSGGRSHSGVKRGKGRSPSAAHSSRSARASASSSAASSNTGKQEGAMPPPHAGRPGVGGALEVTARLLTVTALLSLGLPVSVRVCGPRLVLPGLAWGLVVALPTFLQVWQRRTTLLSTRSIWTGMTRCELFFDSAGSSIAWRNRQVCPRTGARLLLPQFTGYGQSLPWLFTCLFPPCYGLSLMTRARLWRSSWMTRLHGFLPVSGHRHQKYYRTSSSSFPGPYMVPPGLASITLEKVSESLKHSVSMSHLQVSSLETMLSSVCEVTSWLDWWLSTCGGLREHLTDKARGNFEWLMLFSPTSRPRKWPVPAKSAG